LTDKIEELSLEYNSLMINSENSEAALNQLIRNYSQDMYYFVDAQAEIELQLDRADSILALFTVLIIFVISSFLLVVFNNTVLKYYSLKNDYAKVKILGIKNSQIINNLFKEIIILFLCLIIVGTLEIILLSNFLKYLLLFFDYYKNLTANIYAVIISYSAILFVLLVSYLFYFLRIRKLEVSNEIRVF
jgi:predicted lysophospholipase L1 biosynthesis ABC-type transport system permease subunit